VKVGDMAVRGLGGYIVLPFIGLLTSYRQVSGKIQLL
jgi:hypothetical protein